MSGTSHFEFRKSSYSMGGRENCVEVADIPMGSAVRDSQHPELGYLMFDTTEWRAFLEDVKHERL